MVQLHLLHMVHPLGGQLLALVARVDVVEDREFRSGDVGEVLGLTVTDVPGKQELVMEDHTTHVLVVVPTAHSSESDHTSNVEEDEDEPTSGTGERLVMGGNLLRADRLNEVPHVVVVSVHKGVLLGMVGVHIAFQVANLVFVVTLAVFGLVFDGGSGENTGLKELSKRRGITYLDTPPLLALAAAFSA